MVVLLNPLSTAGSKAWTNIKYCIYLIKLQKLSGSVQFRRMKPYQIHARTSIGSTFIEEQHIDKKGIILVIKKVYLFYLATKRYF